ncbi:anti-sigma factor [Cytobacillus pseudoceanisediminis]|uniref:anti-sigma factor n=1 Tax=Cytobacillus pseudoceanisediminis TaxID=3051614 RepID=UPI003C2E9FA6
MNEKCEIVRDLLPMYIDDLTSKESNEFINRHLQSCPECTDYYNNLKEDIPEFNHNEKVPSENTEKTLIKKIRRRILLGASALTIFFLTTGIILGIFGDAIFQEGNPLPLVKSIIKLESTDADYVQFSEMPVKYISKSTIDREEMIKRFMEKKNWIYKEQMGNSYFFIKDGEEISVSTRQFTRKYFTWEVPADSTLER